MASFWLPNMVEMLEPTDLSVFNAWFGRYINNWAKCDTICNHTIGGLLEKHPESVSEVKRLAKSKNRWLKRPAVVSLIVPPKKVELLQEVLEISTVLLNDKDDMIKKGVWLAT